MYIHRQALIRVQIPVYLVCMHTFVYTQASMFECEMDAG